MAKTLVGLYDTLTDAERIIQELAAHGFSRHDIILASHQANGRHSHDDDVGEWIAADAGSDVTDRLTDLGVPMHEASSYAEGVRRGGALVVVEASDDLADRGLEIMNRMQPVDIDERAALWRKEGWTGVNANTGPYTASEMRTDADPNTGPYTASKRNAYATEERVAATAAEKRADATQERVMAAAAGSTAPQQTRVQGRVDNNEEVTIPVAEEQVTVGKREVEHGRVRIHTRVKEHPVEESVRLREEKVSVERRRVDRPATEADFKASEETIEVTETAEVPVVNKTARVVEEVVIRKEADEHTEAVRETVRRTDVEVDRDAAAQTETRHRAARSAVTGAERTATATTDFSAYDADYRRHHGVTFKDLGAYTEYEPAYRYGYDLGIDERYRGRHWTELETDFRRDWEVRQPGTWEKFKGAIRHAWEKVTGQDTTSQREPVVVPGPERPAATGQSTAGHATPRAGALGTAAAASVTDFSTYDADYRRHHGAAFMGQGAYVDYEPAYRYGYDLGMDERYRGRNWPDLEMDFRRDWEVRQPGTWEKFKDAIRYGWDRIRART